MRLSPLCFVLLFGCASAPPPVATTPPVARAEAPTPEVASVEDAAADAEAPRTMSIEGLTGSLSLVEAQRALEPRNAQFAQCFLQRATELEQLSGEVRLFIRVAPDGSVELAYPEESTLGDREAERCVVEVAEATRFPRPRGGAAELRWPLAIDSPAAPAEWDTERVASTVEANSEAVLTQCVDSSQRAGFAVRVTAYVHRDGRVLAAGAAAQDEGHAASIDCVASAVRGWRLPRTSHMGKVSFDLRS